MSEPTGLRSRILGLLAARGCALSKEELAEGLEVNIDDVSQRLPELIRDKKIEKTPDEKYSPGSRFKQTDIIGEEKKTPPEATLDPKDKFMALVKSTGVKPDIVPTIANLFFDGDIDKLTWLDQVLTRYAAGFVAPQQRRIIRASWAHSRDLPYDPNEFQDEETPETGQGKGEGKGKKGVMDLGMGWQVKKDKDGEWIPVPGGDLDYEAALIHVERLNMARGYGTQAEGDGGGGDETGKPRGKVKLSPMDMAFQAWMAAMVENMVNPKKGEDSEELKLLRREVEMLRDDKERAWRETMEANLAAIASRDPFEDYEKIQKHRRQLGLEMPTVTDSSPAVQLIKDTGDKIDKKVDRALGILELSVPKEYNPEKTRTSEQKEEKAAQLLNRAEGNERSRALRRKVFGV